MKLCLTVEEARTMSREARTDRLIVEANPNIMAVIEQVDAAIKTNAKKGSFDCTINVNVELNSLEAIFVQSFFSDTMAYSCVVNDSKNGHTIIKIDWRTIQ